MANSSWSVHLTSIFGIIVRTTLGILGEILKAVVENAVHRAAIDKKAS